MAASAVPLSTRGRVLSAATPTFYRLGQQGAPCTTTGGARHKNGHARHSSSRRLESERRVYARYNWTLTPVPGLAVCSRRLPMAYAMGYSLPPCRAGKAVVGVPTARARDWRVYRLQSRKRSKGRELSRSRRVLNRFRDFRCSLATSWEDFPNSVKHQELRLSDGTSASVPRTAPPEGRRPSFVRVADHPGPCPRHPHKPHLFVYNRLGLCATHAGRSHSRPLQS
jgi:hypothetical protein